MCLCLDRALSWNAVDTLFLRPFKALFFTPFSDHQRIISSNSSVPTSLTKQRRPVFLFCFVVQDVVERLSNAASSSVSLKSAAGSCFLPSLFSRFKECGSTCARWVMFNWNRLDVGLSGSFETCIFTPNGPKNVYLGNAWILYWQEMFQGVSNNPLYYYFFVRSLDFIQNTFLFPFLF